ncbi:MAG: flagellar hook-basal body complex protein FliE [Clostridiales Family XIII bacterium]|jgi:flagellar hook-basal body complex protein FliE|nr:flagellar hook-basal body complex protein FliE [Clostridiales Family XIII bacterium]
MFITPINSSIDVTRINSFIDAFEGAKLRRDEEPPKETGFKELFQGLINDVEKTEAIAETDAYKLSIGAMDDPHTATIDAAKAELTLTTMVQIRNKVLDAYSEIMRVNV